MFGERLFVKRSLLQYLLGFLKLFVELKYISDELLVFFS